MNTKELGESSFNMTRGGMKILRGGSKNLYIVLQNQHMTSSYRFDGFQLNNLMTCATQLYHVVFRYNKCSLSNFTTSQLKSINQVLVVLSSVTP